MTQEASNTGKEQSWSDSHLEPGDTCHDSPIPLRRRPVDEFYIQENEFADIYAPIVGPFAAMIYDALCRNSYGKTSVEYSVRGLARGMSTASAARAIQILEAVGLIKRLSTSGNRKSICQLFDVKALAKSHGAIRPRKSAHFELPEPTRERLKTQVRAIREWQQGKIRTRVITSGKENVEIAEQSGFHSLFSVSQRDATVSHLLRQRVSRETQMGTHLIQKEERIERIPPPTPAHSAQAQKGKDFPDEDEPDRLLKWASANFIGAIEEWEDSLFDTSKPPASYLANGAADAEKFGFKSLAVKAVRQRGKVLVLTFSTGDPAAERDRMLRNAKAARAGLEKYRKSFGSHLRKWFECEVDWEIADL